MKVLCAGDVMTDVVARLPGPLATGSDTPAPIVLRGGGSAANTACWLAVAGASVTFVGCVGDDALGRAAVAELRAAGVEPAVRVDADHRTGTCIVLVAPSGERTMIPDAGANGGLAVPDELLGPGTHLHLSGYALLNPRARPAALDAMARAHAAGVPVSVDAASAAPIAAAGAEAFLSWLDAFGSSSSYTTKNCQKLVFANQDEALVLTGQDEPARAASALAARYGEAVVKAGPDGAVWAGADEVVRVRARRVRVVDSTGAGDAFAAGFLAARCSGADPAAALTRGHELAARAVGRVGARPAAG